MANIIVQFYPWPPDTGELLNLLAAQAGQPHATELLGFTDSSQADRNPSALKSTQSRLHDGGEAVTAAEQSGTQDCGTGVAAPEQSLLESSKGDGSASRQAGTHASEQLAMSRSDLSSVSAAPQPSGLQDSSTQTGGTALLQATTHIKQEHR